MKKALALLWLALLIHLLSVGQPSKIKVQLTDNSIVKDSAGTVYTAQIWRALLQTGTYMLRAEDPKNDQTAFILVPLSEEQIKKRKENTPRPLESRFFNTGRSIANFKTTDINGHKYNLKDLKGKVVVINFWFINCMPCRREIPELNKLVSDYKDSSGIVFLAIALDEKSELKEFLAENRFDYNIIDRGRYITSSYGVTTYPTHVVLDKQGKVIYHTTGYSSGTVDWLRRSVEEAIKE